MLEFQPIIKRIRWGGTRLRTVLGKEVEGATDAAESWEIVDHGDDQSIVLDGPWKGRTLTQLVLESGDELMGRNALLGQFPLLIKFLDANDRLSLQVHPDDARAKQYNPVENGKTEAWVILSAEPGSRLYAGLKRGVDRNRLKRALSDGTVEDCLHSFPVTAGDCVFIPAGTVHAIGEGILLAEIQQSSDLTFRLHDWGRVGPDGKPRPIHVAESLDCTDFERGPVDPVKPVALAAAQFGESGTVRSNRHEELVYCQYFVMHRHVAEAPFALPCDDRFHVLMVLGGSARFNEDDSRTLRLGQTLLAPACRGRLTIEPEGSVTILDAFLP